MRALAFFFLVLGSTTAFAQTAAPDLRARVDELGKEVEGLRAAAAEIGTVTQALADVSAEIERLKARLAELEKGGDAAAGGASRMDGLETRLNDLQAQVAALRAAVQAASAPESASAIPVDQGGGRFTIDMHAYAQLRFVARTDEVLDNLDETSMILRRARLKWSGHAYSPDLTYKIQLDFGRGRAELLDFFVEGRVGRFKLRGGQFKMPFTRSFLVSAEELSFVERPVAVDEFRYDRDIGLMASASFDRVDVSLAVVNGAGRNVAANDNIDPLIVARLVLNLAGEPEEEGDLAGSETMQLAIGLGGTFENAPVPELVEDMNTDVDGDGRRDNVRVIQAGVDVAFRLRGFGLEAEAFVRKEDWGTIGAAQTPPLVLDDETFGAYAQASYFILPSRFQVGARWSWTEVSPLRLPGRSPTGVTFDVRTELSLLAAYYRFGHGVELSAMWSFLDWATEDEADEDPLGVGEQRFLLEAQVAF